MEVRLQQIVDLTDVEATHLPLGTTAQELTGDWRGYRLRSPSTSVRAPIGIAQTQALGAVLFACKQFEGFLAISAKVPYSKVLGIFPERLRKGAFLSYSYTDAAGKKRVYRIPA
ncbi:MAG TPA: hypothetical protein VGL97_21165 [Bryobacteraceae bacterium]